MTGPRTFPDGIKKAKETTRGGLTVEQVKYGIVYSRGCVREENLPAARVPELYSPPAARDACVKTRPGIRPGIRPPLRLPGSGIARLRGSNNTTGGKRSEPDFAELDSKLGVLLSGRFKTADEQD